MRNYARIAIVLSLLVAVVSASSVLIGFYIQHHYQSILDVYNSTKQFNVKLERYHRGWFHSDATLHLEILDPNILELMNVSDKEAQPPLKSLTVDQTIQHGPIFYDPLELPYVMGLAMVQNKIRSSTEMNNFIHIINDVDYVSFRGNYHKYLKIESINLIYPMKDKKINIDSLEGSLWLSTKQHKVQGEITFKGGQFQISDTKILIPDFFMQFNNDPSFLFGNDQVNIPSLSIIENGKVSLTMTDVQYKGSADISHGMMQGRKDIFIHQINLGDYQAGPFHIDLSVNKVNAKAFDSMIEAYQSIRERGELYQSQLMQKMLMMLPEIFNKGTEISVNDFNLTTQDGQLHVNGDIFWDLDKESIPDQLGDIVSAANIKLNLKIAKTLMNRWIDVASSLPWFNKLSPQLEQFYSFVKYETMLTTQLNTSGILNLVAQEKLKDVDAKILLSLQKTNASPEDYNAVIKELLLNKMISQDTSHVLLYLYTQAEAPLESMRLLLQHNQQRVMQSMSLQLKAWIDAGYIKQQHDDYIVSFLQQKNRIKINEHWLSQ